MRWHLAVVLFLSIFAAITAAQASSDCPAVCFNEQEEESWIFQPSYFSHEPASGERVAQYAPEPTSYLRDDPTYLQSGYRHNQTFIRGADGSADRMHIVETWGKGDQIRPYGEWEFPYRAGATPYGPWGNPQGPWTVPFDSWQNPYGLMQHFPYQNMPNGPYQSGPESGFPFGGSPGVGPGYGAGYGSGPGYGPGTGAGYGHGTGPMHYAPPLPHSPGEW
jgi:hypothetical protein